MAHYSMWMLEYAHCPTQPVSSILSGQHNKGERMLTFSYLVLKGEGHIAMVDVGYNYADYGRDLSDHFGVVDWQPPHKVLAKIGVSPEEIDTILLTHAHFDHMGNMLSFPNAHFYLQKREINEWIWALSLPARFRFLTQATDPQDVLNAVKLSVQGRMTLVDGPVDHILPGIHLRPVFDSHTFGSELVVVENAGETWVVAGDNAYAYENIEGINGDGVYVPVGFGVGSQVNMLMALEEMVKISGGKIDHIIIGHEPKSWERYSSCQTDDGLYFAELSLAPDEHTRIR